MICEKLRNVKESVCVWIIFGTAGGKALLYSLTLAAGAVILNKVSDSALGLTLLLVGLFGVLSISAEVYITTRTFQLFKCLELAESAKKICCILQALINIGAAAVCIYLAGELLSSFQSSLDKLESSKTCAESEFAILHLAGSLTCNDCLDPIADHEAVFTDLVAHLDCTSVCGDCKPALEDVLRHSKGMVGSLLSLLSIVHILAAGLAVLAAIVDPGNPYASDA